MTWVMTGGNHHMGHVMVQTPHFEDWLSWNDYIKVSPYNGIRSGGNCVIISPHGGTGP